MKKHRIKCFTMINLSGIYKTFKSKNIHKITRFDDDNFVVAKDKWNPELEDKHWNIFKTPEGELVWGHQWNNPVGIIEDAAIKNIINYMNSRGLRLLIENNKKIETLYTDA